MDLNLKVEGEPEIVTEIRHKILDTFKDLQFIEETHQYFLNGVELPSVSHVIHQFEEESDFDAIAERYANKNNRTKEDVQDEWKFNNLRATTTGTLVHSHAESLAYIKMGHPELITDDCKCKYVAEKNWLIPTRHKEMATQKFFQELDKNLWIVLPEAKIFSCVGDLNGKLKQDYAGTFDLLLYYDDPKDKSKSGLFICDWKTNAELNKEFSRSKGKYLKEPFFCLYDEPFSLYQLQLNCYTLPLEAIGLKVLGRRILWLKDDETYEKIKVDDFRETLKDIL